MKKNIWLILAVVVLMTGCYQLKPTPLSNHEQVDQVLADLESSLKTGDAETLDPILDEQLEDFIGSFDDVQDAEIVERSRTSTDTHIIVDADLYLQLIKDQELYTDVSNIEISIEKTGDKWTGEQWIITGITRQLDSTYVYQNPATNGMELVDRFIDSIGSNSFLKLRDLFAETIIIPTETSVYYYSNNLLFIAVLEDDFNEVTINECRLENVTYSLDQDRIQVTGDLILDLTYNSQQFEDTVALSLGIIEIPEGLVINRISYTRRAFGLL